MDIKKVFSKDGMLNVVYESNGTIYSIKSSDTPKESLSKAMHALKGILLRNLEVVTPDTVEATYADDTSYKDIKRAVARQERMNVFNHYRSTGLSHSFSEQNGDTYRIIGVYETSWGLVHISTSPMCTPPQGEIFWTVGNKPTEYPKFLTEDDISAIRAFLAEVEVFVRGEREQKELFDEDGEPTEDADNVTEDCDQKEEPTMIDFPNDREFDDFNGDDEEF